MHGVLIFQLPVAIWLAVPVGQASFGAAAVLPAGNSPEFRHKMAPSAPDAPVARPVRQGKPVKLPRISSGFGYRTDPLQGGHRMHAGIDIPGRAGTEIRASAPGTIRFAGWAGGYGRMVEIDHGNGLTTRYGHLGRLLVRAGERIGQEDVIGLMGSTGRSTGNHLHFEVRANGSPRDPLRYMAEAGPAAERTPAAGPRHHVSAFAVARSRAGVAGGAALDLP